MDELGVEEGQVVAERYRLVKLLGHGGMGSVWKADHLTLLSPVAVKILEPRIAKNNNSLARFLREAKAAAMLRSPHVVQILDHGSDGPIAYIAMEILEGESLYERLESTPRLSPELTATVMTHVGRAVGRAHDTGIIHRDLKPDNIFLVPNDDEIIAKVLDFGIAKSALEPLNVTGSPQTATGALLGTPYYMSPEQATGSKDVDHRSDLWALGVITFECLCGQRPFQSDSLGDLVLQICSHDLPVPSEHADVPDGFDSWFAQATARDPDARFQAAGEMTKQLRDVLLPSHRSAVTRPRSASGQASGRLAHAEPEDSLAELPAPAAGAPSRPGGAGPTVSRPVPDEEVGSAPTVLSHDGERSEELPGGNISGSAEMAPTERDVPPTAASQPETVANAGTLEPLSSTAPAAPSRTVFWVVGALAAVGIIGALVATQLKGSTQPAPAEPPSGATANTTHQTASTSPATEPSQSATAESSPTASVSAAPTSVAGPGTARPPATARPPTTVPPQPTAQPTTPATTTDPLGI